MLKGLLLRHRYDKLFLIGISGGEVNVAALAGLAETDDALHVRLDGGRICAGTWAPLAASIT